MNETTEVKNNDESLGAEHPFETTEDRYYIVSTPLKGTTPDRVSITIEGTKYRLSEYMGTLSKSQFLPNTICYRSLEVE